MDSFIGQIMLWPIPWVPQDWHLCDGSSLPVNQYVALYSLIGNRYGGDNINFNLPDLRNLVPMGAASVNEVAQKPGNATVSLNATGTGQIAIGVNNLPAHSHAATFTPGGGTSTVSVGVPVVSSPSPASVTDVPGSNVSLAQSQLSTGDVVTMYSSDTPTATLKPFGLSVPGGGGTIAVGNTGAGQAVPVKVNVPVSFSTLQPALTLNFIICLNGLYPTRP